MPDQPTLPGLFDDLPDEIDAGQLARLSFRNWKQHLASLQGVEQAITRIIDTHVDAGAKAHLTPQGVVETTPMIRKRLEQIQKQLAEDLQVTIEQAEIDAWNRSNAATDAIISRMAAGNKDLASLLAGDGIERRNAEGMKAFLQREVQGMKLSDRVWKITEGLNSDMGRAIEVAVAEGVPATKLSKRVRELLHEPHKLFRRVRDKKTGELKLSQAAQQYHPGTGVYRSSYKNAMRLARTEVNMAYHAADNERWTKSWWVKGIRVQLSNNHTMEDSKGRPAVLVDICDALAGDYPADFKFTGWHPQCRCFATAITCSYEDIREYYTRKRAGEDMSEWEAPGTIHKLPANFSAWMQQNAGRLSDAAKRGTTPYFIRDNAKYTGAKPLPKPKATEAPTLPSAPKPIRMTAAQFNGLRDEQDPLFDRSVFTNFEKFTKAQGGIMADFNIKELEKELRPIFNSMGIGRIQEQIGIDSDGNPYLTFEGGGVTIMRSFTMQDGIRTVNHEWFTLSKALQKKGYSKQVGAAFLKQYQQMGIEQITVHADIDVGGYAWARAGFYATNKTEALNALGKHPEFKKMVEDFYKGKDSSLPFPMRMIADAPGGKEALMGADWHGVLDLRDPNQLKHYRQYLGMEATQTAPIEKKKTIQELAAERHAARTKEQINDINKRWSRRRMENMDDQGDFDHLPMEARTAVLKAWASSNYAEVHRRLDTLERVAERHKSRTAKESKDIQSRWDKRQAAVLPTLSEIRKDLKPYTFAKITGKTTDMELLDILMERHKAIMGDRSYESLKAVYERHLRAGKTPIEILREMENHSGWFKLIEKEGCITPLMDAASKSLKELRAIKPGDIPRIWSDKYNALIDRINAWDFKDGIRGIYPEIEHAANIARLAKNKLALEIGLDKISDKMPERILSVFCEKIEGLKDDLPNREFFDCLKRYVPLVDTGEGNAYHTSNFFYVHIDSTKKGMKRWAIPSERKSIFYHEYGHAFDNQANLRANAKVRRVFNTWKKQVAKDDGASIEKKLKAALAKEKKKINNEVNELLTQLRASTDAGKAGTPEHDSLWKRYSAAVDAKAVKIEDLEELFGAFSDCLMAATEGSRWIGPRGHNGDYFKSEGKQLAEFIAHCSENYWMGNEHFKELAPDLYEKTRELIKELMHGK